MPFAVHGSNKLLYFTRLHPSLMKFYSSVLVVMQVVTANIYAQRAATFLINFNSIRLPFKCEI